MRPHVYSPTLALRGRMGQVVVAWPSGWHGRGAQSIVEFLGIRLGCREAVTCVGEFVAGNLHHLNLEWGKRACDSICQLLLGDQSRLGSITIDLPFWLAFAGSSPPRPLRHAAAGLDGGCPGEGNDTAQEAKVSAASGTGRASVLDCRRSQEATFW